MGVERLVWRLWYECGVGQDFGLCVEILNLPLRTKEGRDVACALDYLGTLKPGLGRRVAVTRRSFFFSFFFDLTGLQLVLEPSPITKYTIKAHSVKKGLIYPLTML